MPKKKKVKRSFRLMIDGIDKELPISVATKINFKEEGRQFIHIDQFKNGTYRLVWTAGIVDEWSDVEALVMVREDEDG